MVRKPVPRWLTLFTATALVPILASVGPPSPAQGASLAGRPHHPPGLVPNPAGLVDPFIGTTGGGNESPGAHAPFGMVTWGPDTPHGGDGGGYEYHDKSVTGFSLTHLAGVGCPAAGEIPVLPTTGAVHPSQAEPLAHGSEAAAAGSYSVQAGGITTALTATTRTGLAQMTFPAAAAQDNLVFKLAGDGSKGQRVPHAFRFSVVSRTEVQGSVTAGNFCGSRSAYTVHFDMQFSAPFAGHGTYTSGTLHPGAGQIAERGSTPPGAASPAPVPPSRPEGFNRPVLHGTPPAPPAPPLAHRAGAYLTFSPASLGGQPLLARVGLSYLSAANAAANLRAEQQTVTPGTWDDFATVQAGTQAAWNSLLGRIQVTGGTRAKRSVFYTALYHALSYPTVFSDVNGQYQGMNGKVQPVDAGHSAFYTNFSGWDIYRTQAQLMALLDPSAASDAAQSMLDDYQQGGALPKWVENNTETRIMVGDPADPMLADYYAFGAQGFDTATALSDMVAEATDATPNRPGLNYLTSPGYLPANGSYCAHCNYYAPASASLEYDTDDFAISALAGALGASSVQQQFLTRAQEWQNLLNPRTGFMQPRTVNGAWVASSHPLTTGPDFAEGDAWQYTGMVGFNLRGLIQAKGGNAAMAGYLNQVLSQLVGGKNSPHAALGNEPSIGLPWEYDYIGEPYQTQVKVRQAQDEIWRHSPSGLAGNDDLGTMSAWFVWSALGMYPMTPGTADLALGSPMFPQADITLGSGATLTIAGNGASDAAPYVQSATWTPTGGSATSWDSAYAPPAAITGGGTLSFTLGTAPDTSWAATAGAQPPSYPAATPPASRSGAVISTVGTDECLDDAGSRTANGNKIDVYACNGTGAQRWQIRPDGTLRVLGKCLALAAGGTAGGTPAVLSDCLGTPAQQWQPGARGRLVNVAAGKCLEYPGPGGTNGTQLDIRTCSRAASQKWVLPYSFPPPPAGRVVSMSSHKCLDDAGGGTRSGTKVDIYQCNGSGAQRWIVEPDGTVHSGLGGCLDVRNGGTADGTLIDYFRCNNTRAQQWRWAPGTTTLLNPASGKCLTVRGPARNGDQLRLWDCGSASTARWRVP